MENSFQETRGEREEKPRKKRDIKKQEVRNIAKKVTEGQSRK